MSLFDLAAGVQTKTERLTRSRQGSELATNLRERLQQIAAIADRTGKLQTSREIIARAVPSVRVPRQRLRQRVKGLEKLETAVATDINKLTERDALDATAFDETLKEAEGAVLETWRKFAKPAREVAVGDVDDPVADELRNLRQQLDTRATQLPAGEPDIAEVIRLKKKIGELTDRLLASGYDEEILRFLAQTRTGRGVPLAEVLAKPKLLQWLQEKKHAAVLRVVHEAVLSQPFSLRS